MSELAGLLSHVGHHAVGRAADGDAGVEVNEGIAVDVDEESAARSRNEYRNGGGAAAGDRRLAASKPDPDDRWAACDEEPPGVSIRPLSHGDLQALLAHLDHHEHDDEDEGLVAGPARRRPAAGGPVVAVRVRASVGRPGASAHAEYRRRRAAERASWTRGLPWRAGAVLAAGVAAGLLGAQVAPHLAGLLAVVAAAGLGWRLRFRPSTDTLAWRRGAADERRTAKLLARLERRGWAVLHDLAIPGSPANIDHLVIGPGGVAVIDSKQYRGRLRLDRDGMVWHGRQLLVSALRKVLWEADQADEVLGIADVMVAAVVAVHGASIPWGLLQADAVTIVPAQRLPGLLQALPPMLGPSGWPGWPTEPGCGSAPPPDSLHGQKLIGGLGLHKRLEVLVTGPGLRR